MSKRILVAEDDEHQRRGLQLLLESHGFTVFAASDGLSAWQLWQKQGPFDFVLTDGFMPNVDGWELAQKVRVKSATVPIVILSSQLNTRQLPRYFTAGLSKPCKDDDLLALVRKLLT